MNFRNRKSFALPIGIGVGALMGAVAVLLFGQGGARRRSLIRDRARHIGRVGFMYGRKAARNATHQALGSVEEIKASWRDADRELDDDVLISRVRAQIGKDVQNMRLLEIAVDPGQRVIVRGPVLQGELAKLRNRLRKVRGVREFRVEATEHSPAEMDKISGAHASMGERHISGF